MKTKLTTLILLIGLISLQSQTLLEDGAEWYYTMTTFWQPGFEYNRCYIDGDTIINQKECKIYCRENKTCDVRPFKEYIYEEDQKLFYYDTLSNDFLMLYDYSASVGDTVTIKYWPSFTINAEDSLFYMRVDSIDNIQIDTINLKRFYVTYDRWDDEIIEFPASSLQQGVIIEKIGSLKNFFHFSESGACDFHYNINLRCFSYPALGTIKFENVACDTVTETKELQNHELIEVYPNPFNNELMITSGNNVDNVEIVVYDINGRNVYRKKIDGNFKINELINLSDLPDALYVLNVVKNDTQVIYSKKIMKE